ncbi:MAG TPA: alpha/beta family hydrolase [Verrucomicrobiae bacterium]|nr:alpha/beta family hydrolase [Verrucomicrobiae bacterium]
MVDVFHRNFFIAGPAGRLEALLWTVSNPSPNLAALVCHPHPLFGGTMHNKVVYQAAKTFHRFGIPVLRFNFRGAGLSEGVHDRGRGELDDVRAALDFLAREYPARPLLLAGFSFGSWVGLRVGCEDARVAGLIGLGIPVNASNFDYLRSCFKPKLFVQGGNDQFGSRHSVEKLFAGLPEPKDLVFVDAVDHFFAGHLESVGDAIGVWLGRHFPQAKSSPPSE